MSIQTRLLKARYSEQNIRLSYKDIYFKTKQYFYHTNREQLETTVQLVINQVLYPVKKDKYYKDNHQKIVEDYLKYCNTPKTNKLLFTQKVLLPIRYYILNKHLYNNTYEHIGISITVGILQHMRKAIMKQMILRKELPLIYDRTSPSSNGYYPLYKPMLNKTTAVMRDNIYNLSIDLVLKHIEFHKRYTM